MPSLKWNSRLDRMVITAEVRDATTGAVLLKKEMLQKGNILSDDGNVLPEGIYKVTYTSNSSPHETASEYFLTGYPRSAFDRIKGALAGLSWDDAEQLNIEAQTRRAGILFEKANYDAESRQWQERVLFTLGSLAEYIRLKKETAGNIFIGMKGLQLKGFISKIDNSKQFYRLFIPSGYKAGQKLPLLLILATPMSARDRPFLESRFVASQGEAVQIGKFAEKFGFGILWPGYRNAPTGWTYESTYVEEVLQTVEKDYAIDKSRISLYGICGGGYFAGRLAATFPSRYAAIVYDRAIFERDMVTIRGLPNSIKEWFKVIDPTNKIIENTNIKILVLNDGSKPEGHGEIQLSRDFLAKALSKRNDIKYALGQRKIGVSLWDSIFEFLSTCKNEHPDSAKADIPAGHGYAGPMSEVFATPFIVVEGTAVMDKEGQYFMNLAISNFREKYRKQFYGAEFIVKKDTEVTDDDIEKYSLVLVGNAESNLLWGRLAAKYPNTLIPYNPPDAGAVAPAKQAFAEVFKNPANRNNYVLIIGADKLNDMELLESFEPCTAWFDCYINKSSGGNKREMIFTRRPENHQP